MWVPWSRDSVPFYLCKINSFRSARKDMYFVPSTKALGNLCYRFRRPFALVVIDYKKGNAQLSKLLLLTNRSEPCVLAGDLRAPVVQGNQTLGAFSDPHTG